MPADIKVSYEKIKKVIEQGDFFEREAQRHALESVLATTEENKHINEFYAKLYNTKATAYAQVLDMLALPKSISALNYLKEFNREENT